MGKCSSTIEEVRFVFAELTECYVRVYADGDCPFGVQGWHFKAFPPTRTMDDILKTDLVNDYLIWPQKAPARE